MDIGGVLLTNGWGHESKYELKLELIAKSEVEVTLLDRGFWKIFIQRISRILI